MEQKSIREAASKLVLFIEQLDSQVLRRTLDHFNKRLKAILISPEPDQVELDLVRKNIFATLQRIQSSNKAVTLQYAQGEEHWTIDGPVRIRKVVKHPHHYMLQLEYKDGRRPVERSGAQLRDMLLDKEGSSDEYQLDIITSTAIGEYYNKLKNNDLLINEIEPHVSWEITENSEPTRMLQRLNELFVVSAEIFTDMARQSLRTVVTDTANKTKIRNAIRDNLIQLKQRIFSGEISFEEAKIIALQRTCENTDRATKYFPNCQIVKWAYSEAYSCLYAKMQSELQAKKQ